MFNHPSMTMNWHKTDVETAPNRSTVSLWLPENVMDDAPLRRQIIDAVVGTYVLGVITGRLTPEKVANRHQWGERLDSGMEGTVYRLQSDPSLVSKIFKPGKGTNVDTSNGIAAHRAGKSVIAHSVLGELLKDVADYSTPKAKAVAVHPESQVAVTILDFVEGQVITDEDATKVHDTVDEILTDKGVNVGMRKILLHDLAGKGKNVLRNGHADQGYLFPTYSLIDR